MSDQSDIPTVDQLRPVDLIPASPDDVDTPPGYWDYAAHDDEPFSSIVES